MYNIIHHKKIHPRIPSTTWLLKYKFKISNCDGYYLVNIFHTFKIFNVGNFKIIDKIKSKANQIYLKQVKII